MKSIEINFYKSGISEKRHLYIAYTINLIIINMFLFFCTQYNLTNDSFGTDNGKAQMISIFSGIFVFSVIVISFFQWIVNNLFLSLYQRRKDANINLRLIGIDKRYLKNIYFKEYLIMNILTVPVGIIISLLFSYLLVLKLPFNINIYTVPIGCLIHIVVTFFSIIRVFRNINKKDLIEQIRNENNFSEYVRFNKWDIVFILVGILLLSIPLGLKNEMILARILDKTDKIDSETILMSSKFILILAFLIIYNVFFKVVYISLDFISKKFNWNNLLIASNLCLGELKKTKNSCFIILISCTLFVGLEYSFLTIRTNVGLVAENNLHYVSRVYKEDGYFTDEELEQMNIDKETSSFAVYFDDERYRRIIGITSEHFENFETLVVAENKTTLENGIDNFDNSNWNGMFIPQLLISKSDLGRVIETKKDEQTIELSFASGYEFNIFDTYNSYVSRSYLENILQIENQYNMIFLKEELDIENIPSGVTYQTKEGLVQVSKDKATNSTEIVEIFLIIIILCGLISFINHSAMNAESNKQIIAKMRGMGILNKDIIKIYLIIAIIPIVISFAFVDYNAKFLAKLFLSMSVGEYCLTYGIQKIPYLFVGIFSATIIVSIICKFIFIKDVLYSDKYIEILRDRK